MSKRFMLGLMAGGLGCLFLTAAVIGRFWNQPTVSVAGMKFEAGTLLTLTNTCFLAGLFLFHIPKKSNTHDS